MVYVCRLRSAMLIWYCGCTGPFCEQTAPIFLSHESRYAKNCACHPWQERPCCKRLDPNAGAMLFFSTPKENMLHFSVSSVGRLNHPHSPLLLNSNQEMPSRSLDQNFHGYFEPFQTGAILGSHVSADSSSGLARGGFVTSCHRWPPPQTQPPPRSTDLHQFHPPRSRHGESPTSVGRPGWRGGRTGAWRALRATDSRSPSLRLNVGPSDHPPGCPPENLMSTPAQADSSEAVDPRCVNLQFVPPALLKMPRL